MSFECFSNRRSTAKVSWCKHKTVEPWAKSSREAVEAQGSKGTSSLLDRLGFGDGGRMTPLDRLVVDFCRDRPGPADISQRSAETGNATALVSVLYKWSPYGRAGSLYTSFRYRVRDRDMATTKFDWVLPERRIFESRRRLRRYSQGAKGSRLEVSFFFTTDRVAPSRFSQAGGKVTAEVSDVADGLIGGTGKVR